jgi:hypothetical protein
LPDKLAELLSFDPNKDPIFDPLELEGVRSDRADRIVGEDTFCTVFFIVLLPVLSMESEETLLEDESDGDDLTEDFLAES